MQFTDSHCHLDFKEFSHNKEALIQQCLDAGISRIIIPGITSKRWPRVLTLCQQYHHLYPALGLHPWWIDKATTADLQILEQHIQQDKLIAVGEIGIDGAINDIAKQTLFFEHQLELAKQYQLPVIVHHRKSHHLILPILKRINSQQGGIIHAFSGNMQQAKGYLDLGFKLGIGGTITYPRAKTTRQTVVKLPLESLVLETDAPAMPLYGFQGKDNSPMQLIRVFEQLATLRAEPKELIARQIEANLNGLFSFDEPSSLT
ncbi:TatD family hydrolase [Thalassotalea aquiviva]|uniref:TatD family hydrolase n=1 Tax=Thalassotalea aquiviva TaxID=3242415 RepID=UPI00352A0F78